MAVQLSAAQEALLDESVRQGIFQTQEQALDQALLLLKEAHGEYNDARQWIHDKIARAMAQADRRDWIDPGAAWAELVAELDKLPDPA